MSPLIHNIIIAGLSLIYVFSVIGLMDAAVKKGLPQDLSRKIVHISAGSWLIFWPLFDQSDWSKYLNITPAFIWTILLLHKGFFASAEDKAVKTMTRTGDRRELLRGPLYFTIVMNIMGTVFFYTPLAIISMGLLGWGDGIAPLFGSRFGKHQFNIVAKKTIEGSVAFLIFGFSAAIFFNYILLGSINIPLIFTASLLAVFVEAISPKDLDNILIPLSCTVLYLIW